MIERGDVWDVDLDPTLGHEQAGLRPALVVSHDALNRSRAELVVVVPMTSRGPAKKPPTWVSVTAGEGGTAMESWIMPEQVRSISTGRVVRKRGRVKDETLAHVADKLRIVLGL